MESLSSNQKSQVTAQANPTPGTMPSVELSPVEQNKLGESYLEEGNYKQAIECFVKAANKGNNDAVDNLTDMALRTKNTDEVLSALTDLTKTENPRVYLALGNLSEMKGQSAEAVDYYTQAANAGSKFSTVYLEMMVTDDFSETAYKALLGLGEKNNLFALRSLKNICEERKQFDEARTYQEKIDNVCSPESLENLKNEVLEKNSKLALITLQDLGESGNLSAIIYLGQIYKEKGQINKAVTSHNSAILKNSNLPKESTD